MWNDTGTEEDVHDVPGPAGDLRPREADELPSPAPQAVLHGGRRQADLPDLGQRYEPVLPYRQRRHPLVHGT
jgi:hypothetical protein